MISCVCTVARCDPGTTTYFLTRRSNRRRRGGERQHHGEAGPLAGFALGLDPAAVRHADKDKRWAKRLVAAYQSPEVKAFIGTTFKGSMIPAF